MLPRFTFFKNLFLIAKQWAFWSQYFLGWDLCTHFQGWRLFRKYCKWFYNILQARGGMIAVSDVVTEDLFIRQNIFPDGNSRNSIVRITFKKMWSTALIFPVSIWDCEILMFAKAFLWASELNTRIHKNTLGRASSYSTFGKGRTIENYPIVVSRGSGECIQSLFTVQIKSNEPWWNPEISWVPNRRSIDEDSLQTW